MREAPVTRTEWSPPCVAVAHPGWHGQYAFNNQAGMIKCGPWWVHKYFPKFNWIKTARIKH